MKTSIRDLVRRERWAANARVVAEHAEQPPCDAGSSVGIAVNIERMAVVDVGAWARRLIATYGQDGADAIIQAFGKALP